MGTKKKVASAGSALANRLAAEEGAAIVHHARGSKVRVVVRLSNSSHSAMKIGISLLYCQSGVKRTPEIKEELSLYCKGSKRKGQNIKQSLGLEISEGKKPMSREVYSYLAKHIHIKEEGTYI